MASGRRLMPYVVQRWGLKAIPRPVLPGVCAILFAVLTHGQQPPSPLPSMPPRPGGDVGPTRVSYVVWIGDIRGIDSVAQTFSASLVVGLRWHDPQLAHAGPGAKRYALDDIWHPRYLIANESDAADVSLPETADVAPDGTVVYRQRIIGSFAQSLNLRAFPFDRDTFRMQFVVLGHRPAEIEFVPDARAIAAGMSEGVGIAEKLTLQDWRVLSATTRVESYPVTPGIELAAFTVEFVAARQAIHFVIKVILPLVLIVAMSWAVFWIEPNDANTQMAVAVTAMLTLIAYRFAIDSDVPKLPYLTRLDAFVLMSTLLVFVSIIQVLVTTKFASMDRIALSRTIDRHSRWVFPLLFFLGTSVIFLR